MKALEVLGCDLSILLTDDTEIAALNLGFRGREGPTDVLSFRQSDPFAGLAVEEVHSTLLGDVVISLDTAARQVTDGCLPRLVEALRLDHHTAHVPQSWTLEDEVACLMVHGVLHLVGHDHEEVPDAERMFREEADIIPRLLRFRAR